jgi:hypothetical protein
MGQTGEKTLAGGVTAFSCSSNKAFMFCDQKPVGYTTRAFSSPTLFFF